MSLKHYSERHNVAYFIIISCLYHFQHLRTIWSLPASGGAIVLDRPYFDDVSARNVTAVVDETAILKCRVRNRANRTISWMRKRDLHILTSNSFTYTSDQRFSVDHPANSDDWNLKIEYAQRRDSGIYECQVNTEPKINMAFHLEVTDLIRAARAKILGSQEVHVKKGSTISLSCSVNVHAPSMAWLHDSAVVDFDSARGGISLETEKTDTGTTSRLMLTRAALRDSGNYTCQPAGAVSASVVVHVLNGEHPAAMQTSSARPVPPVTLIVLGAMLLATPYHAGPLWLTQPA
ncbi:zwei Ig domain protein zig-8 isoform X2 [Lutzomyia longipalpis]|uniref:Ig-like domain-containing protein n=1 Tax=Lutzomyia longipalpis TaxID=7200 RepID=A0A1B0CWY6_LUTLO|nr:zwei Ig domain protein zig-8 isoform X2 [Lutzomyia longipalpis]